MTLKSWGGFFAKVPVQRFLESLSMPLNKRSHSCKKSTVIMPILRRLEGLGLQGVRAGAEGFGGKLLGLGVW